jgi:hypothetical protein
MEIPWATLIWLTIAVSVYLFGIWEGRGKGYKQRQAEEEQEKKQHPSLPATPVTVRVDDPGLMRIKSENGYLTLDLDGVRADTTALTADQRKRLIEMLTLIRPWLEGRAAPAPAPTPPASAPASTMAPPPAASTPIPSVSKPISQPVPRATPRETLAPAMARITSEREERPAPTAATGIVGQIDAILQARLVGTALEGRGIYLSNSPEGGVIVNVGLKKFSGIDEVPYPDIKAALRAAISEWENKYTPGL